MKPFDVLDRRQNIRQSLVLEASAGTGKTFSIENIAARLLLEAPQEGAALSISEILVVTFTRAAAKELKERIRKTLQAAVQELQSGSSQRDYLQAIIEGGGEAVHLALHRLKQAIYGYDQAAIFTIHGFCLRALSEHNIEADWSVEMGKTALLTSAQENRLLDDLLRSEIDNELVSPQQLKILLSHHRSDPEQLKSRLLSAIQLGPIAAGPSYCQLAAEFILEFTAVKSQGPFKAQYVIEDYLALEQNYCQLTKVPREQGLKRIASFAKALEKTEASAADFEQLIADGLYWVKFFKPERLKKRGVKAIPPDSLHYPHLTGLLEQKIEQLVDKASDPSAIFALIAGCGQELFAKHIAEQDLFTNDTLLQAMAAAAGRPAFAERISARYKAAIIDEFQDTDPLQWEIFSKLFASRGMPLYLVGDPKQSIYSFRQADIYTYLKAIQEIGEEKRLFLNTNYRSQPALVACLNALFDSAKQPGLIALPRLARSLECQAVAYPPEKQNTLLEDNVGALHICAVNPEAKENLQSLEEEYFFPFLASEIMRLNQKMNRSFSCWALLVADRLQAERAAAYLKRKGIPCITQREENLAESPAVAAMIEVLEAVLSPGNLHLIKAALGSCLLCWNHQQVVQLTSQTGLLEQIAGLFKRWQQILFEEGFSRFWEKLLQTVWFDSQYNLAETLIRKTGGEELYQEFCQLAEAVLTFQMANGPSPIRLLTYLKSLQKGSADEEEDVKIRKDFTQDAVNILTLHMSKGLEFDIVFPLGLIREPPGNEDLMTLYTGQQRYYGPIDKQSEMYQLHCKEKDAEKIRQFYVAVTRAKERLYLPIALINGGEIGERSPLQVYLEFYGPSPLQVLRNHLMELEKSKLVSWQFLMPSAAGTVNLDKKIPRLVPPCIYHCSWPRQYMHSFSSLSTAHAATVSLKAPNDFQIAVKNMHTLPSSSGTGTLLHKLLEKFPLEGSPALRQAVALEPFVEQFLLDKRYLPWKTALAEILYQCWHHSLPIIAPNFSLGLLSPDQMYREMEFLYPAAQSLSHPVLHSLPTEDSLKGVIDLVFSYEGKYYIVDWKSNWLGPDAAYYSEKHLMQAMVDNGYDLQSCIYREALRRYLHIVESRDFAECYGGCLYIYLRGIQPEVPNSGVFFIK